MMMTNPVCSDFVGVESKPLIFMTAREYALSGIAGDVPILPSGFADMGDVLGFVSRLAGDRKSVDGQALIDQKPHPARIHAPACGACC